MTGRASTGRLESSSRLATDIFLLAGFCGFLFFFGLSYFGLIGADEPRYAQVAREMLARHDWITPTLKGTPWLEKPALYYWQAMVAYRVFGVSDWVARLPSAADATLMVIAIYIFLKRFRPGSHLDGTLIAASCAAIIGFARAASTDMPLAAMFTIAMLAWYVWYESRSKTYLSLFFFFLGFGALAKGPVALLLAVLIIALFTALKRESKALLQTLWIPGIAILLAVMLPWYVAVQIKNPEFFRVFILEHNLARFGTNLYHHPEPFWYYAPVTLLALLPWTVFAVIAIFEDIRSRWRKQEDAAPNDSFNLYLIIWLIVPLVFFSISQSKLPGYILPAVPAGALLVADYIRLHLLKNESLRLWQTAAHSIVAGSLLFPALMIQYILVQHRIPWSRATVPILLAALCATCIGLLLKFSGLRMLRFATLIPVVLIVGVVLRAGSPWLDAYLSARPLANAIAQFQLKPGNVQVAVFEAPRETEFGLSFYLNRPIPRYELHQIPAGEHLVVAPHGSQAVVASSVAGRRVSYLGTFAPQELDYFWVGAKK
ncbi:MAG: ArnT family glycosyltransferase [Terriglobales bacterium]